MSSTFYASVMDFWKWFPEQALAVTTACHSDNPEEHLASFMEEVRDKIGGLAWVFGPGEDENALSFTVTGEGNTACQVLSQFWLESAVEVPGWNFYASRQAAPSDSLIGMSVEVGDDSVDMENVLIQPQIDQEQRQVDIRAWHPVFEHLEENDCFQILFLLLDEALGEFGTQTRIGEIQFEPATDAIKLIELPGFLEDVWEKNDWPRLSPLETYTGYEHEPSDQFLRSDTIAGFTCLPQVVFEYLNNEGPTSDDPVEDTGAQLLFIELNEAGVDDCDDPLEYRTKVEEEVKAHLAGGGGVVTGAATGLNNAYIDVIIFDDKRSVAAIEDAVNKVHAKPFKIHPFITSENDE